MALGIRTADSFTIKELFYKLCQNKCDGNGCTKLAPYLDVFMLTRRCLSISGGCPFPLGPLNVDIMENNFDTDTKQLPPDSFLPIPGRYQYRSDPDPLEIPEAGREAYYDYGEVKAAMWSETPKVAFRANSAYGETSSR
ncbi:hypothetical protein HBI52_166230 [Parastagonospora nodorum]|nr:hypothetical protein HBI52_166230 [Parastagonospora nodorum]